MNICRRIIRKALRQDRQNMQQVFFHIEAIGFPKNPPFDDTFTAALLLENSLTVLSCRTV